MDIDKIIKQKPSQTRHVLEEIFDTKDIDSIYVKIISQYLLDIEEFMRLWLHLNLHGTYLDLVEKYLLDRDRTKNFSNFFSTILYVYDLKDTVSVLKNTLTRVKQVKDKEDVYVEDAVIFLKTAIGEKETAPVPEWVNIKPGENRSLLSSVKAGPDNWQEEQKRYDELLDKSTDIFFALSASTDNEGTVSRDSPLIVGEEKLVKDSIPLDVRKTIQNYLSTIAGIEDEKGLSEKDRIRTRVFGPQNRFDKKHCPFNLDGLGPCRMLNCYCRGSEDEDDNEEWFTGSCDVCKRKILDKSHVVRYPYPCGGWDGVFCSFDCLRQAEYFQGLEVYDEYIRLENLKYTLDRVGIMDRTQV